MMDSRLAVGGRRTLIKDELAARILRRPLVALQNPLKDPLILPILKLGLLD